MDPVMLVEVLDVHGHVQQRQRIAGAGAQCRIGRSLACELVLEDAFAAAEHTLLTLRQDGRVHVQDLGSRNGTRLDGQLVDATDGRLITAGELRIGRSRVRVRTTEQEALAPERLFRRDRLLRHRTMLAVGGLLLCFTFAAFLQWSYAPAQLAQRVVIAELLAVAVLAVWVGAWALVSRLTVGAWQVRVHLAIAAICVALWVWGYCLYALAAFALQWRWLGAAMAVLAAVVAYVAAYLHLRNATMFHRLAALLLAALVPPLLGGVWWLVDLQVDPRSVNRVEQGPNPYLPALRLAPSVDAGDYLSDLSALKRDANRNRQASLLESPILDAED
jgi:hypothetical protein